MTHSGLKQERVIGSILAGRDVAVIMPTGGGKSLCYQLPAILFGGTTIVVSPLIALMHDQAAQLAQMGIPATVLNSTLSTSDQAHIMAEATRGTYRLLYLSPERLARPDTFGWLQRICRSRSSPSMKPTAFRNGVMSSGPNTGCSAVCASSSRSIP